MKIILLKDVKKQGKKNDVLIVKDGYGTFLINKGDAVLANTSNMIKLENLNIKKQNEEQICIRKSEELKEKLEKLEIKFKMKTGERDKVFGSISPKQIVEELKNKGYEIDKKQIKKHEPISTLGNHIIQIELYKKVVASISIQLVK